MSEADLRATAARVGGSADLLDVRLRSSSCTALAEPSLEAPLTFSLDLTPQVLALNESQALVVSCEFRVVVVDPPDDLRAADQAPPDDDGDSGEIARLACTFAALYHVNSDDPPTDEECDAFARTAGVFALYPYARAWIQDTTARMGLPPLTLGAYQVPITDPNG